MVRARNITGFCWSVSILKGMSPKISFNCGCCGRYNETRISIAAIENKKPYAICSHCGEINDTQLVYK